MPEIKALEAQARQLRRDVVEMIYRVQSGHPGGSLSAADIVTALYFHKMRIDPKNPAWAERDRFVLSKGHAGPIVYAALARRGFFPTAALARLRQVDSFLQGATSFKTPGVDMTSGPLGQGLSAALGIALGVRAQGIPARCYCMIGDGEFQEGEIWEAMMAAPKFRAGNLVCFLDNNGIQMNGRNDEIMPIGDPMAKARAFGWRVEEIDGNDMAQVVALLDRLPDAPQGMPTFVVAHTVKGKGVSFMEDTSAWHGAAPNRAQYEQAMRELGGEAL